MRQVQEAQEKQHGFAERQESSGQGRCLDRVKRFQLDLQTLDSRHELMRAGRQDRCVCVCSPQIHCRFTASSRADLCCSDTRESQTDSTRVKTLQMCPEQRQGPLNEVLMRRCVDSETVQVLLEELEKKINIVNIPSAFHLRKL